MADEHEGSSTAPTAGIIIIGDEILKGHTKDLNSYFLVTRLWSLGVKVLKISVIADDKEAISHEVREFSSRFTFVITTGGIGPTHDDVTISSIAKAFNETLVENKDIVESIASAYQMKKGDLNEFHLRMAKLPPSTDLLYCKDTQTNPFPVIRVRNVYVFPGVPDFLEKNFEGIKHVFSDLTSNKFHLCFIYLSTGETEVAHILDDVHESFKDSVQLGSYPDFSDQGYQVKLSVESESEDKWKAACKCLLEKLPPGSVIRTEGLPMDKQGDVGKRFRIGICVIMSWFCTYGFFFISAKTLDVSSVYSILSPVNNSNISACVKGAWAIIREVLRQYNLNEICLSFNGGKDCTVLVYLVYAAVVQHFGKAPKLNVLYIQYESAFPEAEEFIRDATERYNLNLISMKGSIKASLENLKVSHPHIKAILMGTRRHDPFTEKLRTFTCTDPGWPEYMRVNPILDWHHSNVWSVILHFKIPYCSLYDKGYTSLGSMHNTKPNPLLKIQTDSDDIKYRPAYLLEDDHQERAGRS